MVSLLVTSLAALLFVSGNSNALSSTDQALCIRSHDMLRFLHEDTDSVSWDSSLAQGAQQWAEYLAQLGSLKHQTKQPFGENLFYSGKSLGNVGSCAEAVLAWYNEIADYSYTSTHSKNGKAIGHFTQVVWKKSVKIGVGIATKVEGATTKTYIVARYLPKGNFVMMHFGESYEDARKRVYTEFVKPRKNGAVTPTLAQLDNRPTEAPPKCPDTSDHCQSWKQYCTNALYRGFMTDNCHHTCQYPCNL